MRGGTEPGLANHLLLEGYARIKLEREHWDVVATAIDTAWSFFRAPEEVRAASSLPDDCGYRPEGVEYSADPALPDRIESFMVCGRMIGAPAPPLPPVADALRRDALAAFEVLEAIAERIIEGLAPALAGEERSCKRALRGWSRLQFNYSQPARVPGARIHELHEDGGFLSLAGATAPGLEVRNRSGGLLPVSTQNGEFVVMPGEILSLVTAGKVQPLYHRVVADQLVPERMAFIFFADLEPSLCTPWISPPEGTAVDIPERVRTNVRRYGLQGFGG